jgi:hypothetical protein
LWAAPLQGNSGFISFHFTSDLQTFPPAFWYIFLWLVGKGQ